MALPQLPAHAQHQLGQRVIEQGTRSREYMQKSRTVVRLFSCMQSLLCQERVLFWEIQTILYTVRSLRSRGGDFTVRSLHSRDLACFDYQNNSQNILLRPSVATSALADVSFALFVHYGLSAPFGSMEWHCLSISFSFPPVIPSHKTPRDDREITER